MDLMEERRFGVEDKDSWCWVLDRGGRLCGSISVVEKERLREGERKEFGDKEGLWTLGEG